MRLAKAYEPKKYETDIYSLWEKNGAFKPTKRPSTGVGGTKRTFSLAAPPPNANANLHIGYALTVAIEDAIVRYRRMKGDKTLFIPGADHAGFETWVVYEKELAKKGKSRFDYSREELYRQVWDFVEKNKHNLESQMRAMGASVDWERFVYTLDNRVVSTTYDSFQKMWEEGLIYRGKRIVNYCTFHGTGFADIEVVHEREKTKLWHIAYPLVEGDGPSTSLGVKEVVIATTRPETKLGQSALMVHPKDKRYQHLVGKKVNQPLVPDSPIPIIADEYVEMDFGTGVVTVTPGHDPNDFEVAQRHKLPAIELITTEGKMSDNVPPPFRGLPVQKARTSILAALEEGGYLREVKDYVHSVAKCYRCGTPIEPLLREQWFISMQPLADKAIKALRAGKINFFPSSKKDQTIRYLQEVKDWNISRQIAWGIPVPAFVNVDDGGDWIFNSDVSQEAIKVGDKTYHRDPDVFDTWFSSGHWPLVTLDWPKGDDFKQFYPLSLMETGGEILYQWVARMIMLGLYLTNKVPFSDVYIHGYVLAQDGAKMSKSLGNVIDPFELIERYGSDALRAGLLTGRRPAINQGYHPAKIKAARNFANKLWNIARYIEGKVGDEPINRGDLQPETPADHWILRQASIIVSQVEQAMDSYRISEAYEHVYHFVWHDFADWYVEASKLTPNQNILAYVLEVSLKITHPFMPFVTEAIWQTLAWDHTKPSKAGQGNMLINQSWPKEVAYNRTLVKQFEQAKEVIAEVRQITSALGVDKPNLYVGKAPAIQDQAEVVSRLAGVASINQADDMQKGLRLTQSGIDGWLDIDPAKTKAHLSTLKTQQQTLSQTVSRLSARLKNTKYIKNAPKEIVEQTASQLDEAKAQLYALEKEIHSFKDIAG